MKTISPDVLTELRKGSFDLLTMTLPHISDRNLYVRVAKAIDLAGGRWSTSKKAFVFPSDPRALLGMALETGKLDVTAAAARNYEARQDQLRRLAPVKGQARQAQEALREAQGGAGHARAGLELMKQLKHIPGFFPTPPAVVAMILERAQLFAGAIVLEPSAGKGNIATAAREAGAVVQCVELNHQLSAHLKRLEFDTFCGDFTTMNPRPDFHRVLMNPPFERRQDEAHTMHAFEFLKPGGRLVSVVSSTSGERLTEWAELRGGAVEPLPARSFATSERPTGVNCSIVTARA